MNEESRNSGRDPKIASNFELCGTIMPSAKKQTGPNTIVADNELTLLSERTE